jgi:hypothetical protein
MVQLLALQQTLAQTLRMFRWFALMLALEPAPVLATMRPLSASQRDHVQCVAVLAIIANEQQRGVGGWEDLPPLAVRGAKFSDRVIQGLSTDKTRKPDAARAEILAQVAALQSEAVASGDPSSVLRVKSGACIAMLDAEVPPPQPPTLPQCAAALAMAYDDEVAHLGLTKAARTLSVFAALLDARARDALKAEGKSEAESDIVIGLEKEKLMAEFKASGGKGTQDRIDFPACFAMARP